MVLGVNGLQTGLVNMRVNLGGRNIRMPQHFLYDPKGRVIGQQVACKGVPKGVRLDVARDAGGTRVFLNEFPYPLASQRLAAIVQEDF